MSKAAEQQQEDGGDDLDWQFRGSGEQYPISFVDNPPTEAELEEVGLLAAGKGRQKQSPMLRETSSGKELPRLVCGQLARG